MTDRLPLYCSDSDGVISEFSSTAGDTIPCNLIPSCLEIENINLISSPQFPIMPVPFTPCGSNGGNAVIVMGKHNIINNAGSGVTATLPSAAAVSDLGLTLEIYVDGFDDVSLVAQSGDSIKTNSGVILIPAKTLITARIIDTNVWEISDVVGSDDQSNYFISGLTEIYGAETFLIPDRTQSVVFDILTIQSGGILNVEGDLILRI